MISVDALEEIRIVASGIGAVTMRGYEWLNLRHEINRLQEQVMGMCPMCQGTVGDELCGECAASAEEGMKEGFLIRLAAVEKERDELTQRLAAAEAENELLLKYVDDQLCDCCDKYRDRKAAKCDRCALVDTLDEMRKAQAAGEV